MNQDKIDELLLTEGEYLQKLNKIVIEAIEEEKLLSKKIYELEDKDIPLGSRMADGVARFAGSWIFILSFLFLMAIWMVFNSSRATAFDPFPFILLNLVLSTIAAIQAPLIIMSQNRKEEKDRQRAINDYLINLKAEIEVRNVHQKLDLLMKEQMETLFKLQNVQVEMITEVRDIVSTLQKDK